MMSSSNPMIAPMEATQFSQRIHEADREAIQFSQRIHGANRRCATALFSSAGAAASFCFTAPASTSFPKTSTLAVKEMTSATNESTKNAQLDLRAHSARGGEAEIFSKTVIDQPRPPPDTATIT
jgi:hypothetical protein